ncbi:unnamed protein product [Candida verbasci]|uniref:RRM domain-containing protein n=1 Tax=Candida verbasci TaxID=1227364 RepID=A0A9W4TYS4_9ASCO|nr:unnamed protein product [Candida verbasci]
MAHIPHDIIQSPITTSNTASHQHQQEQELLSNYNVPNPPTQLDHDLEEKPRTLWMGDLDPWLDEKGIIDLWWNILQKKVIVKLIKPKTIKDNPNYQGLTNSGYCFVEFENFEDAQQALSLNGQLLPDIAMPSQKNFPNNPDNQKKYFRLNWASGATLSAPIIQTMEYSLFVGDLSASTTEAHLLAFFQKKFPDSIKTVRVMTDPISGKSRCFGFVRFINEQERQRALVEMNGVYFGGRPLRVALATPRSNNNRRFNFQEQTNDLYFDDLKSPTIQFVDPTNTTVFVGGLSSQVSEETLFVLFKPFGIIQNIKIPLNKNCAFIKYINRESAENAIASMQGFIINGSRIRLSWGHRSQRQPLMQNQFLNLNPNLQPSLNPNFPPPQLQLFPFYEQPENLINRLSLNDNFPLNLPPENNGSFLPLNLPPENNENENEKEN